MPEFQGPREFLESLAAERRTLIAYESPARLVDALQAIRDTLGDRPVCVARELSKIYEEFRRGSVGGVLAYYTDNPPRGEITLVIGGAQGQPPAWDEGRVRAALFARLDAGESLSQAARAVAAESGWERRAVYALGLGHK